MTFVAIMISMVRIEFILVMDIVENIRENKTLEMYAMIFIVIKKKDSGMKGGDVQCNRVLLFAQLVVIFIVPVVV